MQHTHSILIREQSICNYIHILFLLIWHDSAVKTIHRIESYLLTYLLHVFFFRSQLEISHCSAQFCSVCCCAVFCFAFYFAYRMRKILKLCKWNGRTDTNIEHQRKNVCVLIILLIGMNGISFTSTCMSESNSNTIKYHSVTYTHIFAAQFFLLFNDVDFKRIDKQLKKWSEGCGEHIWRCILQYPSKLKSQWARR